MVTTTSVTMNTCFFPIVFLPCTNDLLASQKFRHDEQIGTCYVNGQMVGFISFPHSKKVIRTVTLGGLINSMKSGKVLAQKPMSMTALTGYPALEQALSS